ncbi:hypothetical protein V7149_23100 [Bacillus sp. JJ1503]|uniref:hypothetical protein n=1 Tax=Bacillus sp. JJ1503 TaxID=3122956 RepID=UPI002FFFE807
MSDIQKYKDMQKRLTLMQDPAWVKVIQALKSFKYDDTKDYSVIFKEEKQRKNRNQNFHEVTYVEETDSFIFISYVLNFECSELTEEIRNRIVLKDIDIIDIRVTDKFRFEDYFFAE